MSNLGVSKEGLQARRFSISFGNEWNSTPEQPNIEPDDQHAEEGNPLKQLPVGIQTLPGGAGGRCLSATCLPLSRAHLHKMETPNIWRPKCFQPWCRDLIQFRLQYLEIRFLSLGSLGGAGIPGILTFLVLPSKGSRITVSLGICGISTSPTN